jgi:hypothetical protein
VGYGRKRCRSAFGTGVLYNKQTFNLLTQKHTLNEHQHDRQDRQENNRRMVCKVMLGGLQKKEVNMPQCAIKQTDL